MIVALLGNSSGRYYMSIETMIEDLKENETAWLVGSSLECYVKYDGKQYHLTVDYPIEFQKIYGDRQEIINAIVKREFKTT